MVEFVSNLPAYLVSKLSLREHSLCFAFRSCRNKCQKRFFFLLTLFELERSRLSTENCWSSCLNLLLRMRNEEYVTEFQLNMQKIQVTQYR